MNELTKTDECAVNPLLQASDLPAFDRVRPEHVIPAIDSILSASRTQLTTLLDTIEAPTWENLIEPLEELLDRLNRTWSPVSHLNSVVNTDALREAHDDCLPKLTDFFTDLGQNERLHTHVRRLHEQADGLNATQRKILDDKLQSFRLAGVDLDGRAKARFKEIQSELSRLASVYQQNVLKATDSYTRHFDSTERLSGLPDSTLSLAAHAAETVGQTGWLLTLQMPCFFAVMTYADSRKLRQEFYLAYHTRATGPGSHAPEVDNTGVIERTLALRAESAALLGFANYAEMSLATKMAESPAQVMTFLLSLADKALPVARRELADLQAFARDDIGDDPLMPWDVMYYAEKLREARYAISQEALKPWFPAERVISGLFRIVHELYGVDIVETAVEGVWHADVRLFEVRDRHGTLRGRFFLDLYARQSKRGGAWMDECINRRRVGSAIQVPVAHLVCNLTPPVRGLPAMFTHSEVTVLFHEFGHGLHHMLTQVDYPEVSGINGVEWDAVELPSQFMENWCWQAASLALISGHFQTGEPLPDAEIGKLRAARNFNAAMQMVRQVEFALFDMRIHARSPAPDALEVQAALDAVRREVAVVIPPPEARFQNGFSHIFAGGYAAGYYSYKWAEVLAADAFETFLEHGVLDRDTGRRFLQCILEQGGSRKAMELFIEFKGREPSVDALLRSCGLL